MDDYDPEGEYDDNDYYDQVVEITAQDVQTGEVDVQGIEWSKLQVTREAFREARIKNYRTYKNLPHSQEEVAKEVNPVRTGGRFYDFRYTKLRDKCFIVHFQLRNLLWATSKNDVFYTSQGSAVSHWCPLSRHSRPALDLYQAKLATVKISTMAARDDFLLVGGFCGEYACRRLSSGSGGNGEDGGSAIHSGVLTRDPNGITNHIMIDQGRSGATQAIISSNDFRSRVMDLGTQKILGTISFDWPVNCSTLSPDKRMLCVVGDDTDTSIVNSQNGEIITKLKGHRDFSFACAWSPCGRIIATGNQDMTTRLYDTRNLSQSFAVFGAKLGAIRSLHFSDDGSFLAMAEPADFVHLFDLRSWDPDFSLSNDDNLMNNEPTFSSSSAPTTTTRSSSSSLLSPSRRRTSLPASAPSASYRSSARESDPPPAAMLFSPSSPSSSSNASSPSSSPSSASVPFSFVSDFPRPTRFSEEDADMADLDDDDDYQDGEGREDDGDGGTSTPTPRAARKGGGGAVSGVSVTFQGGYRSQVIDFFGEIAGISFTPGDAESLYIGIAGMLVQ
ncbi:hypothetical protein HK102_000413 [Quaeritorhiza haematococci]|nr:hypothetical protein HK102_000413 [Quaeritorhiza haematococci]